MGILLLQKYDGQTLSLGCLGTPIDIPLSVTRKQFGIMPFGL